MMMMMNYLASFGASLGAYDVKSKLELPGDTSEVRIVMVQNSQVPTDLNPEVSCPFVLSDSGSFGAGI